MDRLSLSPRDRTCQRAFVLWGWALLLLVLISAAPTGAQPFSRLVGSAFDPSTIAVTVRPDARDEGTSIKKPRRAGPSDDAPDLSVAFLPIADDGIGRLGDAFDPGPQFAGMQPYRVALRAPLYLHPARAPPLS